MDHILVLRRFGVGSRAANTRSRGWKPLFIQFFLHLQLCFCTVHQWSRWPRYRLWVFSLLKLSCTLKEEEEEETRIAYVASRRHGRARPRHLRGNEMRVIVTQPELTRTVSDINGDFSQKSQNFPTTGVFCAQADEVLIGTGCRRLESKN